MSMSAVPPPPGVVPNFEHPKDVLRTINIVVNALVIALITTFVIMRLYIRLRVLHMSSIEDWTCLAAWIGATAYCSTGLGQGYYGGGYHEWELSQANLDGFGKLLYANTIVYGPTNYLVKVTLLLIYIRLFSPFRGVVIFIYVFMAAMLGYYLPIFFVKIQICDPISSLWDPQAALRAKCLDQHMVFVADTIMSAVTDIAILTIPVFLVWNLRMPRKKKLRVAAILGAGGVATLASIVRLIWVIGMKPSVDETVQFVRFNLLGVAEVGIGIVCSCLPTFNIFTRCSKSHASANSTSSERMAQRVLRVPFAHSILSSMQETYVDDSSSLPRDDKSKISSSTSGSTMYTATMLHGEEPNVKHGTQSDPCTKSNDVHAVDMC